MIIHAQSYTFFSYYTTKRRKKKQFYAKAPSAIKRVPVVLADNTQSGHGGTYEQPSGGANARMVKAWLDWQLKGNKESEKLFIGGDLTGYDGFSIQHKNYK